VSAGGRLARGARQPLARAVVAAAVVVTVTVVALWWSVERSRPPIRSTDAVRVGVAPGGSIPEYVADSARDLAAHAAGAARASYALVSFNTYLAPERLVGLLSGVEVAEVIVRVPLPGEQTEIVRLPARRMPDDVSAGLDRIAARKEAEAAGYLRDGSAGAARLAMAEAAGMRQRVACVYAAVVRAAPAELTALTSQSVVRAVDPAPDVREPARAVFLPPLPEQSDFARPPAGR